jgi:hypothetical protein
MRNQNRGLGRRHSPDERDRAFLLARRLPKEIALPARKTWRIAAKSIDQGETGTCVGHGWFNFLRCEPIQTVKGAPSPFDLYRKAVKLDEWPENDGEATAPQDELQSGTSVRAGAEAVMGYGRLKSYLWAFTLQPALEFVLTQGPVVLGTDWPESFFSPDDEGIVRLGNRPRYVGGHCYLWRGADTKRGLAYCENSWGDSFGKSGGFYIPLRDLETLILRQGECCAAVESKLKPAKV